MFFDRPPRAFRALSRLGLGDATRPFRLLERVIPTIRYEVIKHDQVVEDYPALHACAIEMTTEIAYSIRPWLETDTVFLACQKLLDPEGAASFLLKALAFNQVFPVLLAAQATERQVGRSSFTLLVPVIWPQQLVDEIVQRTGIDTQPLWRSRLSRAVATRTTSFVILLRSVVSTVRMIARRGLRFRARSRQAWKVGFEFIDEDHLAGGNRDVDGMVDGRSLKPSDVVPYLTGVQVAVLARLGQTTRNAVVNRAVEVAAQRGYHLAVLDRVAYSPIELIALARVFVPAGLRLLTHGASLPSLSVEPFLIDYLDYLSFFQEHRPTKLLHITFPHGAGAACRWNAGLVTGLARRNSVVAVGMQTRSLYLSNFQDSMDCYDLCLRWGPAYEKSLSTPGKAFIKDCAWIGSTNLDPDLVGACRTARPTSNRTTILAFTVEISPKQWASRSHYTFEYTREYLWVLARFALERPEVDIRIKVKDPADLTYFKREPSLADITAVPNIEFVSPKRDQYRDEIVAADVISAIGFTSPGTDGVLLRKPTVFYSKLGIGRGHLSGIPNAVASTWEEFSDLVGRAVADPVGFMERQQVGVEKLDPFRDGEAMTRVAKILS